MCAGFSRILPIAACCAYAVTRQYRVDSVVEQASPGASNLSRPLFTFSVVVVFLKIDHAVYNGSTKSGNSGKRLAG